MPRFVILEHDHPYLHWDLMLQAGNVLRTWRLDAPPRPGQVISATALEDHRIDYLEYEGPVSNDRGIVKRWDGGTYEGALDKNEATAVTVQGKRLAGMLQIRRRDDAWTVQYTAEA
ncbi:MAG: DNA polymerase ligase N-terminal domain-containing protein [Gemmataceae bacterium]